MDSLQIVIAKELHSINLALDVLIATTALTALSIFVASLVGWGGKAR